MKRSHAINTNNYLNNSQNICYASFAKLIIISCVVREEGAGGFP